MGINNIYISFLSVARQLPRLNTVKPAKLSKSMVYCLVAFLMLANQHGEDGRQQHEDEGLDEPHKQFHEVKRDGQQPAKVWNYLGHRFEDVFASKDVAIETKTQRNRPEQDGKHLETANRKKDDNHQ